MPREQHPFTTGRWRNQIGQNISDDRWFINPNFNSFAYMPEKNVQSLILGTFPVHEISSTPPNPNDIEFFYGSYENNFWQTLSTPVGMPFATLLNRIEIFNSLKIGITDILGKVDRNPPLSNADTSLEALNYNSLINLKESFPSLENIYMTSGGRGAIPNLGALNKNVATWLRHSLTHAQTNGWNQTGFERIIQVNEHSFRLIYLYSSANTADRAIQGVLNRNNSFNIPDLDIATFRKYQWTYFLGKYSNGINQELTQAFEDLQQYEDLILYFEQ